MLDRNSLPLNDISKNRSTDRKK